jgi:UPF0176 protein
MTLVVAAFYQFADVPDPAALRAILLPQAEALGLKGTLILAREGINGTLAGAAAAMDRFLALLTERFDALELKRAETPIMPFKRLKLRIKREIVTLAAPEADPVARVGVYVTPLEWNALLDDPEVTLIDTRNSFEVAHGSFPGSIDPGTVRFGEFPRFVDTVLNPERHRKVAMFCTGGIRCEKATSLLLARGFAEVYHLKGGILGYLAQMPAAENRFEGECFVFDERETVGAGCACGWNSAPPVTNSREWQSSKASPSAG